MTALTITDLQARVDRGVAWLDQHHPGWVGRVDLATLDMKWPCLCTLGQLLGSYYEAPLSLEQGIDLGFDSEEPFDPASAEEFEALTELWARTIEQRRAEQ